MSVPAVLRERLTGEVVHQGAPTWSQGFSALSTRVLVLTDAPALWVVDAGHLLGTPSVDHLEPPALHDADHVTVQWVSDARVLLGQVWLDDSRAVAFRLQGEPAHRAAALFAPLLPPPADVLATTPLPITVQPRFVHDRSQRTDAALQRDPILDALARPILTSAPHLRSPVEAQGPLLQRLHGAPEDWRALLEHLYCGELWARVAVREGQLLLHRRLPGAIAALDLAEHALVADDEPRALHLRGPGCVAGEDTTAVRLLLPTERAAVALRAAVAQATPAAPPPGRLSGHLDGRAVDLPVHLTLDGDLLTLRGDGLSHQQPLVPGALQGTPREVLLPGPLRLQVHVAEVRAQLAPHVGEPPVGGPWRLVCDGVPAEVTRVDGHITLTGHPPLRAADLSGLDVELPRLVVHGPQRSHVLTGSPRALEDLADHLRADHLAAGGPDRVPGLLKALAALETEWLLHTALSPLAGELTEPVALRRHLERAQASLPAWVHRRDVELCRQAEVAVHLSVGPYAAALVPLRALVRVAERLEGEPPPGEAAHLRALVPGVLHEVELQWRTVRRAVRDVLAEAEPHTLLPHLALRFARLENYLRFPDTPGGASRHAELSRLRSGLELPLKPI